jgi:diguanylate cyclase
MNKVAASDKLRILVVDDNAQIHEDFRKVFAREENSHKVELARAESVLFGDAPPSHSQPLPYVLDFASQGQEAAMYVEQAVADRRPYALAFIDMRMPPGWDGLETIEHIWRCDPNIQVVICSAHSDYDWNDVVERFGQSDKLLVLKKPFEPIEVLQGASALVRKWQHERALQQHVDSLERIIVARTENLEVANRQLRHLATHDALTDLPNRVLLDDRLEQAIAHASRDAQPFAVMILDLDRFKTINDTLGHHSGDAVLKEVASRLRTMVRNVDTVARVGGDEFVLVVGPAATLAEAEEIARRANDIVSQPIGVAGVELHVTASIGIALYPEHGESTGRLLMHADAAMYCAKQHGRNTYQCFAPGMDAATLEHVNLESDLHRALKLHQLEIHYQPKVDLATGDVRSAEALVRWRHPERGLILPSQFIPVAEECGLIHDIGEWVLQEACRQCASWHRAGMPPLRVSVNVAASQFRRRDLLDRIQSALRDAPLDPQYLEIELTESVVMTDPEGTAAVLQQLSRMGVLVSVDDFGTGYSSMNYLRRFPIDKLKIDRAFIKDLVTCADDASIVQAIISLAHSLRLKVVAEGVETPEQLNFLQRLGCDQYQGYHFSPAVPAAEFARLIKEWQRPEDARSIEEAIRTHSKLARR